MLKSDQLARLYELLAERERAEADKRDACSRRITADVDIKRAKECAERATVRINRLLRGEPEEPKPDPFSVSASITPVQIRQASLSGR